MKKNIKKIIVGMFAFALLFTAHSAFAATWNGASNDCKGISIVNSTTNEGYAYPCWPSTSVSADAGDTLNIRIYYHNTGTVTANNTKIFLNAQTGSTASSSKSFSGSINSDQGNLSLSSVVANLSSSQTISFNSVKWYTNNTSETLTSLLNGQSGSEILSSGLDIGSIAPGWDTQGSLVVSFHVSNTTAPQLCQNTSASNYGGALPCSYPPVQTCSINSFSANPTSMNSGSSAILSWNTSDCTSVSISNVGNVSVTGSKTVYPTLTTTYILTAYSPTSGNKTSTATVVVNAPTQNCSISNFTTNTSSIASGDPATLSWNTSNCTSVVISNLGYNVPLSGTQTVYPTTPTTYILTAYGSTGVVQTRSVYVNVSAQICLVTSATNYLGTLPCLYYQQPTYNTCHVTSFYADDNYITNGESVLLRWNTENCNSVSISGVASGLASNGSYRVYPSYTRTYILNTSGNYGSDSKSITISVNDNNNNTSYCSIDSFTVSSTYINSGSPVTLRWNTSGCSSVSISNLGYNVPTSGSQVVYPTSTTNYVLSSYGSNNISRSVQVNVNYVNPIIQPVVVYNSNVVTTVATNISQTGAQLNGLITNTSYTNSNVHFEYGTSVNLGLSTAPKTLTGNTNFSEYVSGLSPYTIYYFQAVSEGSNGVSRGAIEVFRTLGTVTTTNTTRTIVVQGTTVVGSESPIMLKIENRYQSIGVNDIIEYTVTYKNIGKVTLTHPILQVIVPKGIILTNYTQGTYAEDTNTLTVQLSDLAAGEEGFINLQGQVVSMPSDTAQIVTTAVLVYTNKNGSQENAMAYVLNSQKVISNNLLGASAFFSGIFPSSLIGWLFLIILILLLILVARSLYNRRDVTTTTTQKTISH